MTPAFQELLAEDALIPKSLATGASTSLAQISSARPTNATILSEDVLLLTLVMMEMLALTIHATPCVDVSTPEKCAKTTTFALIRCAMKPLDAISLSRIQSPLKSMITTTAPLTLATPKEVLFTLQLCVMTTSLAPTTLATPSLDADSHHWIA
jgi:hypothetical protein